MPTVFEFLDWAGMIGIVNGAIYLIGRAMLNEMLRKGQHRMAYHGWYVWVWMLTGVVVGGLVVPWNNTLS